MMQSHWVEHNRFVIRQGARTYKIGFTDRDVAFQVANSMSSTSQMQLVRRMQENVALEVKKSMLGMQLPIAPVADVITIDVMASLIIPKRQPFQTGHPYTTVLHRMEFIDFMMLPFNEETGVIIPYDLAIDSPHEYIFMCNVVDPQAQMTRKDI